ncbi:MAG: hypothetical protein IPN71_16145 [Fibrobacteres bacterium]|nr:hypothetical protein [Fibrobacterota bacterium]
MIRGIVVGALVWGGISTASAAVENITVRVTSDSRRIPSNPEGRFQGFGVNLVTNANWYPMASQELRDKCVKLFWKDLDLRTMRLWCYGTHSSHWSAKEMADRFQPYIDDVRRQQRMPLSFIFAVDLGLSHAGDSLASFSSMTTDSLLQFRVSAFAGTLDSLVRVHGIDIEYVEATNEPAFFQKEGGWQNRALWSKVLTLTRIWRKELDRRGLGSIKVLAASNCVPSAGDAGLVESFKNDQASLAAWGGYSFHSYGSGLLKSVRDLMAGVDLPMIQTESGEAPRQRSVAHAISDLNLGATRWLHFLGYEWVPYYEDGAGGENTLDASGIFLSGFTDVGKPTMDLHLYPKYFFFRELSRAVPPGAIIRRCSTDIVGNAAYTHMEVTDGVRSPLNALAAIVPDGRLSLIAYNASDTAGNYDKPYPAMPENIVFDMPELVQAGEIQLRFRLVRPNKDTIDLPDLTMRGGKVRVESLKFGEMAVLRSRNVLFDATVPASSPTIRSEAAIQILHSTEGVRIEGLVPGSQLHVGTVDGRWTRRMVDAQGACQISSNGGKSGIVFVRAATSNGGFRREVLLLP